jgi:Fe-S-cluster containining protein
MERSFREIDQIFFQDGYRMAEEFLGGQIDEPHLESLSRALYEAVDSLTAAFSARAGKEGNPVNCKKGCHWCCSQIVFMNPVEAFYLAGYLERRPDRTKFDKCYRKLMLRESKTRPLSLKKKLEIRSFCPFLEDRSCSVYEARPMACRIYLSSDVASCIKQHENPDHPEIFARLFDFPLHAGRMLNEGIMTWLGNKKLQTVEITMETGILTVLQKENIFEAWVSGNPVFPDPEYTAADLGLLNRHLS